MIEYEQITKHGTGTTDQPSFYLIGKRPFISGSAGYSDKAIWGVQSAGISLRSGGQKESGARPNSRIICGLYGKTGPQPDQTCKINCLINGIIDQHSSKNGAGRVFIKTRPWHKKRDELNFPGLMTGLVSKSSPRFTVSLSPTQHLT
jgi:hypothetical protein